MNSVHCQEFTGGFHVLCSPLLLRHSYLIKYNDKQIALNPRTKTIISFPSPRNLIWNERMLLLNTKHLLCYSFCRNQLSPETVVWKLLKARISDLGEAIPIKFNNSAISKHVQVLLMECILKGFCTGGIHETSLHLFVESHFGVLFQWTHCVQDKSTAFFKKTYLIT